MHKTCWSLTTNLLEITLGLAFIPAAVTNVKVTITKTNFVTSCQDTYWYSDLSMTVNIFDLAQIHINFLVVFDGNSIDTNGRNIRGQILRYSIVKAKINLC